MFLPNAIWNVVFSFLSSTDSILKLPLVNKTVKTICSKISIDVFIDRYDQQTKRLNFFFFDSPFSIPTHSNLEVLQWKILWAESVVRCQICARLMTFAGNRKRLFVTCRNVVTSHCGHQTCDKCVKYCFKCGASCCSDCFGKDAMYTCKFCNQTQ